MKKLIIIALLMSLSGQALANCWIEKNPDHTNTVLICWHEVDEFIGQNGELWATKNIYCDIWGPDTKALNEALRACNERGE